MENIDHKHTKTSESLDQDLEELGLPLPNKPNNKVLDWPENVGDLPIQELARHLTHWTGWSSYAQYALAKAEVSYKALLEAFDFENKKYVFKSRGDHKTVTEAKGAFLTLPKIQQLKAALLKAEALKIALEALLEGYEKKYSTISREISRRNMDFEGAKR